ncbi:MAG: deoxyribose-phosphate aldolase [Actinomycetales bacterium]|nr:deoxyribose-phosphate aldolase [Actinomycetales bacterium]
MVPASGSLVSSLDDASLHRWLRGLPGVDEAGLVARAARLSTRVPEGASRVLALDLVIRLTDLTTLEGSDTPATVRALCAAARRPDPRDPDCPTVAAVCVYGDLVPVAVEALRPVVPLRAADATDQPPAPVRVAAVVTAFPSGRASSAVRLADTRIAVLAGADEVDMVIDRGAFLGGRYGLVVEQVTAVREICHAVPEGRKPVRLKVILETGELGDPDAIRDASWLAMLGGADMIKTSTGKISPAATPEAALVMLAAVRDWATLTGRRVGVKVAGGIRTAADALRYLVLAEETAGTAWLEPDLFRFGASGLLRDVVRQRTAARRPAPGAGW